MIKMLLLITCCFLLVCSGSAQPRKVNLEAMQGVWQSSVDKNAWLLIKDSDYVVFYKSSLSLEKGHFVKRDSCCRRCEYFAVNINGETGCYEVQEISEKTLSYTYASRGDVHSYVRRPKMPKAMRRQLVIMAD